MDQAVLGTPNKTQPDAPGLFGGENGMRRVSTGLGFAAALAFAVVPISVAQAEDQDAADDSNADEKSPLEELTDFLKALQDVRGTQTNQVTGDDEKTGNFEIQLLGMSAGASIAKTVADNACERINCEKGEKKVLVLSQGENFYFGLPSRIEKIMDELVASAPVKDGPNGQKLMPDETPVTKVFGGDFIAAFGAITALLRSDRTLKELAISSVSARMLADAVAANIRGKKRKVTAITLAGSPGIRFDTHQTGDGDSIALRMIEKYGELLDLRSALSSYVKTDGLGDEEVKEITAWLESFKAFNDEAIALTDGKQAPLIVAIETADIEQDLDYILFVNLPLKGGTRTQSTNFGTTVLGLDPYRVTGGLGATYLLYETPANDRAVPVAWGAITCSTDELRLDQVRGADFTKDKEARCQTVGRAPPEEDKKKET
ncbi:hypothetical protein AAG612_07150 [Citromicrobium bathyomarinum]|uniref:hypothetical protein n=1 Tax=Citromicrobium bathyomarinum TaxID=72174 RepID=UPI003159A895